MTRKWKLLSLVVATVSLSATRAWPDEPAAQAGRSLYLKREGSRWVWVKRAPGRLERVARAVAPARTSLATESGLFRPYVTHAVGSWPEALAIGDVNGDGRKDVAMTTSFYFDAENDFRLFVFAQRADGSLAPPAKYATGGSYANRPATVAIGDVNGDGRNDVVIGNGGQGIGVFLQNAAGGLQPVSLRPTVDSQKVRVADLDGDGRQDVVGVGWATDSATVFLQTVDGTLGPGISYPVTHRGYEDLEVGDVNNDGLDDVVVMSGQGLADDVGVLLQQSGGTLGAPVYYNLTGSALPSGAGLGDVSGDGLDDVMVSHGGNRPSSSIAAFIQNSAGTLDGPSGLASYDIPESVEVADVSGDGRKDVVVAHGGWMQLGVYRQDETGALGAEELYPLPYASHYNPHGLAVGDLDGDGRKDVAVADYNNGLVVLYAARQLAGQWTSFRSLGGRRLIGALTVENRGSGPSGTFNVAFYLSDDPSFGGDTLLQEVAVGSLEAGDSAVVLFRHRSSGSIAGKYVIAVVDSNVFVPSPRISEGPDPCAEDPRASAGLNVACPAARR